MTTLDTTRRRFMATFAGAGLGGTLVPGVLWARVQDSGSPRVTIAMVTEALKLSGIDGTATTPLRIGDFAPFEELVTVLSKPYDDQPQFLPDRAGVPAHHCASRETR